MQLDYTTGITDAEKVYAHNCENIVGVIPVPVGIVTDIRVNDRSYAMPFATTEACLVASINRGAKATRSAQGIHVTVDSIGITRAPVLLVKTPKTETWYNDWIQSHMDELQAHMKTISRFNQIASARCRLDQNYLHIVLAFDTADAMGMNGATIASKSLCEAFFCKAFDAVLIATSGNLCSDKKPSLHTHEYGRGQSVFASAEIDEGTLSSVLKTDKSSVIEVYKAKILSGSTMANTIGKNAHHANMIAAIYIALGQDPAHVVEGSLGTTIITEMPHGIRISVSLPSILVGTVGGGTNLPIQKQLLQTIGLQQKPGNGMQAQELASVIGAAVLCGELSLLCAIAGHQLASAHASFRA